jgi:hypothetical protein
LALVGRADLDGWCEIRVAVDSAHGQWTATSRCLLVKEACQLADWFDRAATDPTLHGWFAIMTIDNMINFELLNTEPRQLRVYLEWDLRPERLRSIPIEELFVDYPVTVQVLRRAAVSLREQLREVTGKAEPGAAPDPAA